MNVTLNLVSLPYSCITPRLRRSRKCGKTERKNLPLRSLAGPNEMGGSCMGRKVNGMYNVTCNQCCCSGLPGQPETYKNGHSQTLLLPFDKGMIKLTNLLLQGILLFSALVSAIPTVPIQLNYYNFTNNVLSGQIYVRYLHRIFIDRINCNRY